MSLEELAESLYEVWGRYELMHGTTLGHYRVPSAWRALNVPQQGQWRAVAGAVLAGLHNGDARLDTFTRDAGMQA